MVIIGLAVTERNRMGRHLTSIADLTNREVIEIFQYARSYLDRSEKLEELKGRTVITVFFENSTRTRSSFEMAAKKLGAEVINLDIARSSTAKGETLFDTAVNLDAMGADAIIVRHPSAGVPQFLSRYVRSVIINAGDGAHQHPTQALLDLFTLLQRWESVEGRKIAIVGDIRNSRVANSNIQLLTRFGAEVILVGPPQFLPTGNYRKHYRLEEVIDQLDAIMALRTQTERHKTPTIASLHDYGVLFKISSRLIGERDILILHPGPVHRNVDIADEVLNSDHSLVLEQVRNGVAVRMGILKFLLGR